MNDQSNRRFAHNNILRVLIVLFVLSGTFIAPQTNAQNAEPSTASETFLDEVIPNVCYMETNDFEMPDYYNFICLNVYTGTLRSVWTIYNPEGITGFNDYHLANFDQKLLSQTDTTVEIEVTSQRYVDTRAPFPIEVEVLPDDIHQYLNPQANWIQSDDPLIVAQAQELVEGKGTQAEAVENILFWVRANIEYDYTFSLPTDASAVFQNRSCTCGGFAAVTTALLRAAGIPARYVLGAVTKYGWVTGDEGGWHAWIEIYYPDAGWVASDPQATINYLDASHIVDGFDQCFCEGTLIERKSYEEEEEVLYSLMTSYDPSIVGRWYFRTAAIPNLDRNPLRVIPSSLTLMLPLSEPLGELSYLVDNRSYEDEAWQAEAFASWMSPSVVESEEIGTANFTIDASDMSTGFYSAPVTVTGEMHIAHTSEYRVCPITTTVTANLWLVDEINQTFLPLITQ